MEYDIEKNDKLFGIMSYLGAMVLITFLAFGNKASSYLKFHNTKPLYKQINREAIRKNPMYISVNSTIIHQR